MHSECAIAGVFVDASGQPIADAAVMVETSDQPHPDIAALTNERGAFRLGGLRAGSYVVVAYGPSGAAARVRLQLTRGEAKSVRLQIDE